MGLPVRVWTNLINNTEWEEFESVNNTHESCQTLCLYFVLRECLHVALLFSMHTICSITLWQWASWMSPRWPIFSRSTSTCWWHAQRTVSLTLTSSLSQLLLRLRWSWPVWGMYYTCVYNLSIQNANVPTFVLIKLHYKWVADMLYSSTSHILCAPTN